MEKMLGRIKSIKRIVIIIAVIALSAAALLCLFSCGAGVDIGEANRVLTSFKIEWPQNFDNACRANEPVNVVISALDQNGQVFNWAGTVTLELSNPNTEVSPSTVTLTNGSTSRNIAFTNKTSVDQDTKMTLIYLNVVKEYEYTIRVTEIDAPSEVGDFIAESWNKVVRLTWSNPVDSDFAGTRIVKSEVSAPSNADDGELVYEGTGVEFFDEPLSNGVIYYYSAFAYDTSKNYSNAQSTSATPDGHAVDITFMTGNRLIKLFWVEDADAESYRIYYTNDGTEPHSGNGTLQEVSAGTTEYPFASMTNFHEYKFVVKAVWNDYESENAGVLRIVPPGNILACGKYHTVSASSDGSSWCWGSNTYGILGDGSEDASDLPVQVVDTGGSGTLSGVLAIAGGSNHTIALMDDNTVMTWGDGYVGQLGTGSLGTGVRSSKPVQVVSETGIGTLSGIVAISAGESHSVALKKDGTVWTWGYNPYGQLGDDSNTNRPSPVKVKGEGGIGYLDGIVAVSANGSFTIALDIDGTVWAWGSNSKGQLGDGSKNNRDTPVKVKVDASNPLENVVAIDAASQHCIALKDDGTVWTWGNNEYGELGDGGGSGSYSSYAVQVLGVDGVGVLTDIVSVSGGAQHTLAITDSNTLVSWGRNYYGELGDGEGGSGYQSNVPIEVLGENGQDTLGSVVAIGAGGSYMIQGGHSVALKSNGTIWGWGHNNTGQLGDGTLVEIHYPSPVVTFAHITAVEAGSYFTVALTDTGNVWAWGYNYYGQLGQSVGGSGNDTELPVQVLGEGSSGVLSGIVEIAAGGSHVLARDNTNKVWGWGRNSAGQLGQGDTSDCYTPVLVTSDGTNALANVVEIAAGSDHSLFRMSGNTVMACGGNYYGQLGNNDGGSGKDKTLPVQVVGTSGTGTLSNVGAISAGASFSLALKSDGTEVYAWGYNSGGQLGKGDSGSGTQRYYPGLVKTSSSVNLTGIGSISAGFGHSLALSSGGTSVYAWGDNEYGQIGNGSEGTGVFSVYAEQVDGEGGSGTLSGIKAVSAGGAHSLALKSDESVVWAWGKNYKGELGTNNGGTYQLSTAPVKVWGENGKGYLNDVDAVSAGTNGFEGHSIALKNSGSIRGWGSNKYGMVGDGTKLNTRLVPVITAPFSLGW